MLPPQVYKLFGSSFGFMLATNVAEPDPNHAATLLACARELLEALQQVPGRSALPLAVGPGLGVATRGVPARTDSWHGQAPAAQPLQAVCCSP